MRTPDFLDYSLIAAVSLLAYLQLPWRPAIRQSLRGAVATFAGIHVAVEFYLIALALVGVVALVVIIEVLPRRGVK